MLEALFFAPIVRIVVLKLVRQDIPDFADNFCLMPTSWSKQKQKQSNSTFRDRLHVVIFGVTLFL